MKFNGNIRVTKGLDDEQLRASIKGGWDKELPAIKDEHGVVIVGHRRLKIAHEEKLDPVIKVVTFGTGAEAEAARIRLANVSNIGGAPLTPEDRKRQAERLHESGLTQEAIAHMLGVSQQTISNDLGDLPMTGNQNTPRLPAIQRAPAAPRVSAPGRSRSAARSIRLRRQRLLRSYSIKIRATSKPPPRSA